MDRDAQDSAAKSDEDDTPSLGIPTGPEPGAAGSGRGRAAPSVPANDSGRPWQLSKTYLFASPEAALVYVACVVAASLVTNAWPVLELLGSRVGVCLTGQGEQGVRERTTWREVTAWAGKLGGREMPEPK